MTNPLAQFALGQSAASSGPLQDWGKPGGVPSVKDGSSSKSTTSTPKRRLSSSFPSKGSVFESIGNNMKGNRDTARSAPSGEKSVNTSANTTMESTVEDSSESNSDFDNEEELLPTRGFTSEDATSLLMHHPALANNNRASNGNRNEIVMLSSSSEEDDDDEDDSGEAWTSLLARIENTHD